MANYPHRTRMIRRECISAEIEYACASGTVTAPLTLPPSSYSIGLAIHTVANSAPVVIKAAPYADHAQTVVNGSFKFLQTGATTATTNITIAITSVGAWTGMVIPAGDQYGAAAPVIAVHGTQLTISCTAATGVATIGYSAVEI